MIETIFSVLGDIVLKRAFELILHSKWQAGILAKAILQGDDLKTIDKERLLHDEQYLFNLLEQLKVTNRRFATSVDTILRDPNNIKTIQTYLVEHPILRDPIQRFVAIRRYNFLIIGHQLAGKTTLLDRMLYSLVKDSDLGLTFGKSEPVQILDKTKRYAMYQQALRELAHANEGLDRGEMPSATGTESSFFLDLEHYKTNQIIHIKFFDYAGGNLDDMTAFHKMVGTAAIDGLLVIIDSHRLVAEEMRAGCYQAGILDKKQHEEKYASIIQRNLSNIIEVTAGMRLLIDSVRQDNIPISIVLTKFDGFSEYGFAETEVRALLYQKLQSTLFSLVNMSKHHLAIAFTSAFGRSVLAKDEHGDLIIEDKYTGLPVLRPVGGLTFDHFDRAAIPLKFLVQSQMQATIRKLIGVVQESRDSLRLLDRLRYAERINAFLQRLDEESRKWSSDGLPRENCAVIARGDPRAREILDALFVPGRTSSL